MKARLVNYKDSLYLIRWNGEVSRVADVEAREFLLNYNHMEYCGASKAPGESPHEIADFKGATVAEVDDIGRLVVYDAERFKDIIVNGETNFISVPEYAQLNGKSVSIVRRMCQAGRIPGVKLVGNVYLIPAGIPYPVE